MAEEHRTRVLVVEDEAVIAALLQDLLEDAGFEVAVAGTAAAALDAQRNTPARIAIVDYGLPDQNGLELARQLGPDARGARPRIILATGWGLLDDRQLDGVVDTLLQKPFNMAGLVAEVERLASA